MTRVVVVGGGIVGASAAYRLARAGAGVTLVDRADAGQATAAGAGIVCPALSRTSPGPWYPLAFAAAGYYPELLEALAEDGESDTGYDVVGALLVATDEAEDAALAGVRRIVDERRQAGTANIGDVFRLDAGEPQRLFPFLAEGFSGLHLTGAARVDGRRLRDGLRRAAQKRGASVVRGEAELLLRDGRVTAVRVDGEVVSSDSVLVAAGAWTGGLCRPLGLDVPVYPQRGQIAHLGVAGADTSRMPIVECFRSHYMLAFPGGRVVVGATREDEPGFDHRITAGGLREILDEALRVAPGLANATVAEVRVGFRPASPDGLPFLGPVPSVPGLVVATGLGPSGLTIGPYVGALAADVALGGDIPLDLTPYNPARLVREIK